ncbi:MAG: hypothetical protein RBR43_00570 [Desulfuromonadaceae bacterium]|nr:hypothetical protein [Desulfuromonas sp.]MDY0184354.1 hypothetical protein [Desulfuromonadaceae bacterium]
MSIFEEILAPLLAPAYGLQCAVIADADGEMIAQYGQYKGTGDDVGGADAIALFGAHQGVVLMHLLHSVPQCHRGTLREISIRCRGEDWFVFPLATEYYLAVAGPHGVCIGRARATIRECVLRLWAEIAY